MSFSSMISFFFIRINLSFLITPKILASNSGNFFVSSLSLIFLIGQSLFINISKSLILFSAKGILSNSPGASSFLCKDLSISNSGEIITSIGKLSLLYNFLNFGSN